jgi:peptide/nickel transport system permease protein
VLRFVLIRFGNALIVLMCVATIVFFLARVTGDPLAIMLPPNATAEQEAQLRLALGLGDPVWVQFGRYIWGLAQLDLGQSLFFHVSALDIILEKLPATALLAAGAICFALVVAIPSGIYAALNRGKAGDTATMSAIVLAQCMPAFWLGILMILLFSVTLRWLPASGMGTWAHLILPSITLGVYSTAIISRLLRSSLIDVLTEDFIRTARAKGLSRRSIVFRHGLRNAALPVVTVVGLQIGYMLGGAILTETVFSWPGIGQLTIQAIINRDFPLVQAIVLFFATCFVIINLIVDLLYAALDPRVRAQ